MRLPTAVSFLSTSLRPAIEDMRARLTDVATEATTGRRSDVLDYLGGKIGNAMLSQKVTEDLKQDRAILDLRSSRLQNYQVTLNRLSSLSGTFAVDVPSAIGLEDTETLVRASRDAGITLKEAFNALNQRFGERFLFSGDATTTTPFGDVSDLLADVTALAEGATDATDFETALATYFDDPAGGFQQTIYQGTSTTSDPDGVLAIDPAIRDFIKGLAVLAIASPADTNTNGTMADKTALLQQASGHLLNSGEGLVNLRAGLGIKEQQIELRQEQLNSEELVLNQTLSKMVTRDQYEAATELKQLESNIDAAYLLTSRLANLSLTNYLR